MLIASLGIFSVVSFVVAVVNICRTPVVRNVAPFTARQRAGWSVSELVGALMYASAELLAIVLALFSFFGLGWLVVRMYSRRNTPASVLKTRSHDTAKQPSQPLVIDVGHDRIDSTNSTTTTATTRTTNVEPRMTTCDRDDDPLLANDEQRSAANTNECTLDDDVASDAAASNDGVPESGVEILTSPAGSGRSQQLFVPELVGRSGHNERLTVEDIYIEAMTLDAEIRVFRRQLDAAGRRELSRIIDFCRDALHRKLLLRSVEQAQGGHGAGPSGRRSVSSENLSMPATTAESEPLVLIAETAV